MPIYCVYVAMVKGVNNVKDSNVTSFSLFLSFGLTPLPHFSCSCKSLLRFLRDGMGILFFYSRKTLISYLFAIYTENARRIRVKIIFNGGKYDEQCK